MEKPRNNLAIALDAREKEIVAIPCHPGTKIPMVRWKMWQTKMPPEEMQREWFSRPCNIAILTTGMVVFDCDDPALRERVLAECGDTTHKIRTPSGGVHLGYRLRAGVEMKNRQKIKGLDIDIRTFRGVEMIPPSSTEKGKYQYLDGCGLRRVSELRCGNIGWTRERTKKRLQSIVVESSPEIMVRRARGYLANIEGAISGQEGHNKTFRVACKLTHPFPQGFGLSFEQAWPLIKEWNEQAEPPWSDAELTHKLVDAIAKIR